MKIAPLSQLENDILNSKQFQLSLNLGRIRKGHTEGKLITHIKLILNYIEKNFKNDNDYTKLRLIGLLHDIGKLGELINNVEKYMPQNQEQKTRQKYLQASVKFIKEFGKQPDDGYSPAHALYSYEFAKQFLNDKDTLDIIKFHDTAHRLREFKKNSPDKQINEQINKVFSSLNNTLMLKFMEADNSERDKGIVIWLKEKLWENNIQ